MLQHLLLAGAAAMPAVRYATACVAIVAAATIALRTTASASTAVFGGAIMLASMVLVALVGRLATSRDPVLRAMLRAPAVAFAWGVVCAAIVVIGLLVSTTFWGLPGYYRGQGPGIRGQGTNTEASPVRDGRRACL